MGYVVREQARASSQEEDDALSKDRRTGPFRPSIPGVDRVELGTESVNRKYLVLRPQELVAMPQAREKADATEMLTDRRKTARDGRHWGTLKTSSMAAEIREIARKSGNRKGSFVKLL